MNEQIKNFIEQSRVQDRGYFIYQYGGANGYQSVEKAIDLEKFVELIVRECIVQCERGWISFCMDPVHNQAIDSCVNRIKKDFGVK